MLSMVIVLVSVFATTASSSDQSSFACYFDDMRSVYLGDVYSVNWMENSDEAIFLMIFLCGGTFF